MKFLYLSIVFLFVFQASLALGADLSPRLVARLASVSSTDFVPVKIVMSEQAKPGELRPRLSGLSGRARRQAAVTALKNLADDSQKELLSGLNTLETQGRAREIRSLWIVNCVACELTRKGIQDIAKIKKIKKIDLNEPQMVLLKTQKKRRLPGSDFSTMATDTAWGVKWIRAPEVWDQGYRGESVIIGELDTGIDYTHTDLANRIWKNPGETPDNGIDDDNNGYIDDYYGYNFNAHSKDPMDDYGHGTHVAGTICGDGTGGTLTGVAPGANVMALKVLDASGRGDEADAWEAIQYAVDNGANAMSLSIGWVHNVHFPDRPSWRTA